MVFLIWRLFPLFLWPSPCKDVIGAPLATRFLPFFAPIDGNGICIGGSATECGPLAVSWTGESMFPALSAFVCIGARAAKAPSGSLFSPSTTPLYGTLYHPRHTAETKEITPFLNCHCHKGNSLCCQCMMKLGSLWGVQPICYKWQGPPAAPAATQLHPRLSHSHIPRKLSSNILRLQRLPRSGTACFYHGDHSWGGVHHASIGCDNDERRLDGRCSSGYLDYIFDVGYWWQIRRLFSVSNRGGLE
ncbi:hypothetical protein M404DRAFT_672843 [Pisolithus tinctorius Marx 270]|uniref:Secreted protein n=1 Tax=Pisolithus tinctorius Marx 270 TaxID=870435 RepID=A0A0C3JT52_PISTI|nr:hypothetical protein M404DRAFT_672843 [Pisolithus tinctorius Marx 270]